VLALALLSACSRTVSAADPDPGGTDRATCAALMADLPAHVMSQARRRVAPGRLTAGWGKPVITLRCGVPKPAALTSTSECTEVNGVGWFAERATEGYLFTTIGRRTYVELAVPSAYAPEAGALTDVAAAVATHDPLVRACV
jgi:hypothetical protein